MDRIPCVTKAEYRGGHKIRVTFDDNSEKTIDFRRYLKGPVFEPLKDVKYFRRFLLDGWTVTWPNGADIAPEELYESADIGKIEARPTRRSRPTPTHGAAHGQNVNYLVKESTCSLSTFGCRALGLHSPTNVVSPIEFPIPLAPPLTRAARLSPELRAWILCSSPLSK